MVVLRETLVKFNKQDCLKNVSKYVAGNSKVFHTPLTEMQVESIFMCKNYRLLLSTIFQNPLKIKGF